MKKIIAFSVFSVLLLTSVTNASYTELDCKSDTIFTENSCNQCFDWGQQSQDANLGMLSDLWKNNWTVDQALIEAEQDKPSMKSINNAVWTQTPDAENFWELTDSVKASFDSKNESYILKAGKSVDWIQSKLGYAYNLTKNTARQWENIGILVYPISTHVLTASGSMEEAKVHKECVLFKSAWISAPVVQSQTPVNQQPVKQLPKTWPEHVLLLLLAMILGFGLLKITQKS